MRRYGRLTDERYAESVKNKPVNEEKVWRLTVERYLENIESKPVNE